MCSTRSQCGSVHHEQQINHLHREQRARRAVAREGDLVQYVIRWSHCQHECHRRHQHVGHWFARRWRLQLVAPESKPLFFGCAAPVLKQGLSHLRRSAISRWLAALSTAALRYGVLAVAPKDRASVR